jgi:hypothetical protein
MVYLAKNCCNVKRLPDERGIRLLTKLFNLGICHVSPWAGKIEEKFYGFQATHF